MSVRKLTLGLVALAAMATGMRTVDAQDHLRGYVPVADPFAFDPDFRWFEPIYDADLQDMRPKKRANTGWFGTFDRMNLYVSRPESSSSYFKFDDGWGNRVDVGFMLPEENGWQATFMNMDGPNARDMVARDRLNRFNAQELAFDDDLSPIDPQLGYIVPANDGNVPGFNYRFYEVGQSVNMLRFTNFELNKTWRLEPYHYGGIMEPLVGFRYMNLHDISLQSAFFATHTYPFADLIGPGAAEQLVTNRADAENQLFGGQVGFRYYKFMDRFTLSTELRVFGTQNFQSHKSHTFIETTIYDMPGTVVTIGEPPLYVQNEQTTPVYENGSEFAFGFDVRGEVGYQLTKMIQVRGGFQLIDVAQGVWRGRLNDPNDQAVFMVGGTFGVALNR